MTKYKVVVPGVGVVARGTDRDAMALAAAMIRGARVVTYRV